MKKPRKRKPDAEVGIIALTCRNHTCRRFFRLKSTHALAARMAYSGLCPRCVRLIEKKRGDLLDPKLWAECQRVIAEEARVPHGTEKARTAWEARKREALANKPLRINPLAADLALGVRPGARSGKVGGPDTGKGE